MKKPMNFSWIFLPFLLLAVMLVSVKCTHEDEVLQDIIDSTYEYGDDIINEAEGYEFVKVHSSVTWETPYLGTAATLTGRFNSFTLAIDFDENNPENTSLSGSVVLSSVNTGEPGRDQGCLLGTFGTSVGGTETATFESTSVEKDGEGGYIVTGDFTLKGVTAPITGKLTYLPKTFFDAGSGVNGAPLWVAGFIMEFDILANSVYQLNSGNIADRVHITCNGQFKYYL